MNVFQYKVLLQRNEIDYKNAIDAKPPEYDSDLGLSEDEFDELTESARKGAVEQLRLTQIELSTLPKTF